MENIQKKIGFDEILSKLNKYFYGELGRSKLENISLMFDKNKIEKELSCVSEFKIILEKDNFPSGNFFDIRTIIDRVRLENSYFTQEELVLFQQSVTTIKDLLTFFKKEENAENYPNLSEKSRQIKYYPFLATAISRILSKEGKIKDSASKELRRIRQEIRQKESKVSGVVHKTMTDIEKSGYIEDGAGIVIRNGKMLIPVLASHKNKVGGVVQDYSGSGKTVYIEPLKSIELNNQIRNLIFEEKREVVKILVEFTSSVRPYIDDLQNAYEFLADIDFIRAKAMLATEMHANQPQVFDNQSIKLMQAYHPLLYLSFKQSNKKIVPLDLELNENNRIILISGPNAGGKSIAVKTVILLQFMMQCGFLITAKKNSVLGIFDDFYVDIGDDQSLESDLSTYSSHLLNMKNIVENANSKSLVVIDEFGSGTDPTMGGAIAEVILENFLKIKAKAVINTHYSNLKYFAAQNKGILNAAMLFDNKKLRPLYLLEVGNPGSSFAFEIAKNIGLSDEIIQQAKDKTGKNSVNFDKIITEIDKQSRKIRAERNDLKKIRRDLERKVNEYRLQKEKLVLERKEIIEKTRNEAETILGNANKAIEKTILEIKSKNAEKQITRKIRKDFETQKNQLLEIAKQKELQIKKEEKELARKQKKEKVRNKGKILVGDWVFCPKKSLKGRVEEIKDGMAMITVGNLRTFIKLNELEKIAAEPLRKEKVKIKVEMEKIEREDYIFGIDVRGKKAEEALEKISKYIDNAIVVNATNLRILHGTGNGVLRQMIRQYLRNLDCVEWYGDADVRIGGQGITLVQLKD